MPFEKTGDLVEKVHLTGSQAAAAHTESGQSISETGSDGNSLYSQGPARASIPCSVQYIGLNIRTGPTVGTGKFL